MNPIEKITDRDRELIAEYIAAYATPDCGPADFCGVDHYLRFWNEAKAKSLFKLFGEQLMVSIPVEWEAGEDELEQNVRDMLYNTSKSERAQHCSKFRDAMMDKFRVYSESRDVVWDMMSVRTLARNRWMSWRTSFTFTLPDGSLYVIHDGIKPMKVLRKLSQAYGIDGFEDFMNAHSLCLNQKRITGNLVLSIHPMDYMTMSDNGCGWETCMSWTDDGQYKQGTVEMMNSSCAVVGYLASENDWEFAWRNGQRFAWNSKKWRSLFLIDEDFVLNVKEYPYRSDTLVQSCLRQLANLKGWSNIQVRPFRASYPNTYDDGTKIRVSPDTGAMYNDFGDHHYIVLDPELTGEDYVKYICYSGKSMCVWCGTTDNVGQEGNEAALCCSDCHPVMYCADCGCVLPANSEYVYWLGDEPYCECCYNANTEWDPLQEEYIEECDTVSLRLNPGWTGEDITRNEYNMYSITIQDELWDLRPNLWKRDFKIDEPHSVTDRWGNHVYYINIEDCVDISSVRALFGWWADEDFAHYLATYGFEDKFPH